MGGGKVPKFENGDPFHLDPSDSDSDIERGDLPVSYESTIEDSDNSKPVQDDGTTEIADVTPSNVTTVQPEVSAESNGMTGEDTAASAISVSSHDKTELTLLAEFLKTLEGAFGEANAPVQDPGHTEAAPGESSGREGLENRNGEFVQDTNKVVFVEDNVAIRPASYRSAEYLPGCLCLLRRESSLLMTWLPYPPLGPLDADAETARMEGNAIKEVAVADFYSVRRFTPLGYPYIIIALKSGLALQPLYFLNGGVNHFLTSLQMHAALTRSKGNEDTYVVNLVRDPLRKSLSQLGLPETVAPLKLSNSRPKNILAFGETPDLGFEEESERLLVQKKVPKPEIFLNSKRVNGNKRPPKPEEIAMNVLEKLSMVTKIARDVTSQIITGIVEDEPEIRRNPLDFRVNQRTFKGKHMKREDAKRRESATHTSLNGQSSKFAGQVSESSCVREKQAPLGEQEWNEMLDKEGRVKAPELLKKRIYHGGVQPSLRAEVWKFLIGYYPFTSTQAEREHLKERNAKEYARLKEQWQSVHEGDGTSQKVFNENINSVGKDVTRTDPTFPFYEGENNPNVAKLRNILVTYSFYNPELGYCQGMCDVLSPLLFVIRDEAETFWSFSFFMETIGHNFRLDEEGMQLQLSIVAKLVQLFDPELHQYFRREDCLNYFFCFRWIFLLFKREFAFENVLSLWDVLLTRHLSPHFHLFMCAGLLQNYAAAIQEQQMDFETVCRFVNDLRGQIDLDLAISGAEKLLFKTTCLLNSCVQK